MKDTLTTIRHQKYQEEKRRNIIQELHEYLTEGTANFPKSLKEKFEKAVEGVEEKARFGTILSKAAKYNEKYGSHFCQETLLRVKEDYSAADNREDFIKSEIL